MEKVQLSTENEALTEGAVRRQNSVRSNEYELGKYLFIPMKHFCVDTEYNKQPFKSKRVLIFKINDAANAVEYVRTWKLSYFTESLAATDANGIPDVKSYVNDDGLVRPERNALNYISSCDDYCPKHVDADRYFHIDEPFMIQFNGTLRGYSVRWEEHPDKKGLWNAMTDKEGKILFETSRITQFKRIEEVPSKQLVKLAKDCLKSDPQLKSVPVD